MLLLLFLFAQGPALLCALVAPFVWRVAQGRTIERMTKILFTWAVIVTAFQGALVGMGVASISPPNACFK